MRSHTLHVLGTEVSFKAEADPEQIECARKLLEERFNKLKQHNASLSKEKLLTFIALALADDYLVLESNIKDSEEKVRDLLGKIESSVVLPSEK